MIDTLLSAAKPLVRYERCHDLHPYGSTVVREEHWHVELDADCVVVRVDGDDLLPVEIYGTIECREGDFLRLRFSMPQVGTRDGKTVVTYEVEVVDG